MTHLTRPPLVRVWAAAVAVTGLLLACAGSHRQPEHPSIDQFAAIYEDLDPNVQAKACAIRDDDDELAKVMESARLDDGSPYNLQEIQIYLAIRCSEPVTP